MVPVSGAYGCLVWKAVVVVMMIFVSVNHHTDGDSAELWAMTILVVCCASHGADDSFSLSLSAMTIETSSICCYLSNLDSWFALSRHELCTALRCCSLCGAHQLVCVWCDMLLRWYSDISIICGLIFYVRMLWLYIMMRCLKSKLLYHHDVHMYCRFRTSNHKSCRTLQW